MTPFAIPRVRPRRIAVVGAGFFSQFHLAGWSSVADVEVVGLCDSDEEKGRSLASKHGVARVFSDFQALLKDAKPDLIDVVVPPRSQASVVVPALEAGIPTICQKPFGNDYAQAVSFVTKAQVQKTPLVVHENFRFMPWYREMRRCITSGLLGKLHGVSFRLRPGDGQGPNAYLDRQPYFQTMPRLLVAETAIHFIDTFRFLIGEVRSVSANLRRLNPAIQGEDAGVIVFDFDNGAAGVFDGNRLNSHPARNQRRTMGEMWLDGSNGVMRLDGNARLWWAPHGSKEIEHPYETGPTDGFGGGACGALQKHVVDGLCGHGEIENHAADYLKNLCIQEAVYTSHRTGCRVDMAGFVPAQTNHHALRF